VIRVGIISGGFDPIHSGHIHYIKSAKELCDILVVGVNSDDWLERKKGKAFMPWGERAAIVSAIVGVDCVLFFNDNDGSARNLIHKVQELYSDDPVEYIFMNGGDRTKENIPEMDCVNVNFLFGVGGADKANSSSWILKQWETK